MTAAVLIVVAALAAAACGSSVRTFSEGDSEVAVSAGEPFRIEFAANPGVGDDWTLVDEPDSSVARFVDGGFESDAPEDVTGAPGVQYFVFEATSPGSTRVVFEYCYRGCGGEGTELEHTVSFDVVVS